MSTVPTLTVHIQRQLIVVLLGGRYHSYAMQPSYQLLFVAIQGVKEPH